MIRRSLNYDDYRVVTSPMFCTPLLFSPKSRKLRNIIHFSQILSFHPKTIPAVGNLYRRQKNYFGVRFISTKDSNDIFTTECAFIMRYPMKGITEYQSVLSTTYL